MYKVFVGVLFVFLFEWVNGRWWSGVEGEGGLDEEGRKKKRK